MTFKIVIASTNGGKIKEIEKILSSIPDISFQVETLGSFPGSEEPEEPYETFLENAVYKARYYGARTKEATLSEDSGLLIEALEGFPGVRTKEFVEEMGGMEKAFQKLHTLLEGTPHPKAIFHTSAVLYLPHPDILFTYEAQDHGTLVFPPRGEKGFSFDPIFIPQGETQTFGELGPEVKNQRGHRAQAVRGLMKQLSAWLESAAK